MKLLVLFFAFVVTTSAQVLEVKGGDSTLTNAAGAEVVLYTPSAQYTVASGVADDHFVIGLQAAFTWKGWDAVAGDQQLFLTTGQNGIGEPLRGLSLSKKDSRQVLTVFAGLTGQFYTAPYFTGGEAKTPAAGFQFTRTLPRGFSYSTVNVIDTHSQKTSLHEFDYLWRTVKVSAAGGVLQNQTFLNGQASGTWKRFGVNATHGDYFIKNEHATVNSEGVSTFLGSVYGTASFFQSKQTSGEATSVGFRKDWLLMTGTELFSRGQRTTSGTITEQLNRHLHLSQYVTRSNGQTTFNYGGGYTSNRITTDIGYQTVFLPFGPQAFAKSLVVQIRFHIGNAMFNGGTFTGLDGKTRWTAYGDSYSQTGLVVPTGPQQGGHAITKFKAQGKVLDADGNPVAGMAVQVGNQEVWTDERGEFQAGLKKSDAVPVRVVPDDATTAGTWVCVDCPGTISPESPIEIHVRRDK